jgi:hypothetical protein
MPADGSPRDPKIQTLLDKQEIHDVLLRYCHGADRRDVPMVISAFHDDAVDNHMGVEERPAERFPRTLGQSKAKWTTHSISNVLIQVDGDVAHAQSYLVASHRFDHAGGEIDWILGARYLDRFERRNGVWRIAHRTVVCDWERFDKVEPKPADLGVSKFFETATRGSRSKDDLSYKLLRF